MLSGSHVDIGKVMVPCNIQKLQLDVPISALGPRDPMNFTCRQTDYKAMQFKRELCVSVSVNLSGLSCHAAQPGGRWGSLTCYVHPIVDDLHSEAGVKLRAVHLFHHVLGNASSEGG